MLFFGDIGRDFFVFQQWQKSFIPPLLGPQTSALPLNQSPFYFYVLFPFYLLFQHSPFSTIWASLIIHGVTFLSGVLLLKKSRLLSVWMIAWFLMAIHPQFVLQHRYIWNPSFVGMFLLSAYCSYELLLEKFSYRRLLMFSSTIALAIGFSYAVFPFVIGMGVLAIISLKKHLVLLAVSLSSSLSVVYAPMLFFEMRHNFILTKLLIFGEKLPQSKSDLFNKAQSFVNFILASPNSMVGLVVGAVFCVMVFWYAYIIYKKKKDIENKEAARYFRALLLFLIVILLQWLLPVNIHAHYIFAVLISGFILIGLLPIRYVGVLLMIVVVMWVNTPVLNTYFSPAFRSTKMTFDCAQQLCSSISEPVFVSVQASYHPYHNGFEFKYLLGEAGCSVKQIETEPNLAELMLVFADDSTYEHGKTSYNELTQFGPAREEQVVACTSKMKVHIIRKK